MNAWTYGAWSFHDDVIKRKHFPRDWPFVRESTGHRWFPSQRPVTQSFGVFFDLCSNNRDAGDVRRYHAHYDVNKMSLRMICQQSWRWKLPTWWFLEEDIQVIIIRTSLACSNFWRRWLYSLYNEMPQANPVVFVKCRQWLPAATRYLIKLCITRKFVCGYMY